MAEQFETFYCVISGKRVGIQLL